MWQLLLLVGAGLGIYAKKKKMAKRRIILERRGIRNLNAEGFDYTFKKEMNKAKKEEWYKRL
jgi:hypothetical protein